MQIPDYVVGDNHLLLEKFREMDYLASERYHLPVELMMENAGLQLARLIVYSLPTGGRVLIGIGPGNNGGGGLVAARRLACWGYRVFLDIPVPELSELPLKQLERALAVKVRKNPSNEPDLFVDAYLGFSQRFPLSEEFRQSIEKGNRYSCTKISLDIPGIIYSHFGIQQPDQFKHYGILNCIVDS